MNSQNSNYNNNNKNYKEYTQKISKDVFNIILDYAFGNLKYHKQKFNTQIIQKLNSIKDIIENFIHLYCFNRKLTFQNIKSFEYLDIKTNSIQKQPFFVFQCNHCKEFFLCDLNKNCQMTYLNLY